MTLPLRNAKSGEIFISGDFTRAGITSVALLLSDPAAVELDIALRPPTTLFNGTYTDRVLINACLDQACTRPLDGSPLRIPITYTLTGTDPASGLTGPPPDPAAPPLQPRSRIALAHDVRDAEYTRRSDRIVMVATYPTNALYVYDTLSGVESSVSLPEVPTAVSISPDGLTAAVAHTASISVVDLAQVGQQPAPAIRRLTATAKVFDLVLDGRGRVHYSIDSENSETLRTVDLATGAEGRSDFNPPAYGRSSMTRHPSADLLFLATPLISSAFERWDITGAVARYVSNGSLDSPFRFACGKVWLDEPGTRGISQCGQVFTTDSPPNVSMAVVGRLALSGPETTQDAWTIASLDHSAVLLEIVLLESNTAWCRAPEFRTPCYHRLALFDPDTLARRGAYALAPITVNGTDYGQRGLFVFHQSNGARKFLLSRLDAISNPSAEYYLSVLD